MINAMEKSNQVQDFAQCQPKSQKIQSILLPFFSGSNSLDIEFISRRVGHAFLETTISTKQNVRSYSLVTADQRGQLEKERTLESSAWLRLIMSSNDFTLETIALSFCGGSSNSPF